MRLYLSLVFFLCTGKKKGDKKREGLIRYSIHIINIVHMHLLVALDSSLLPVTNHVIICFKHPVGRHF